MELETSRLFQQLQSLDRTSLPDDDARTQALKAAQALCHRLETPFEWVQRMTWQEVSPQLCYSLSDKKTQVLPPVYVTSGAFRDAGWALAH